MWPSFSALSLCRGNDARERLLGVGDHGHAACNDEACVVPDSEVRASALCVGSKSLKKKHLRDAASTV